MGKVGCTTPACGCVACQAPTLLFASQMLLVSRSPRTAQCVPLRGVRVSARNTWALGETRLHTDRQDTAGSLPQTCSSVSVHADMVLALCNSITAPERHEHTARPLLSTSQRWRAASCRHRLAGLYARRIGSRRMIGAAPGRATPCARSSSTRARWCMRPRAPCRRTPVRVAPPAAAGCCFSDAPCHKTGTAAPLRQIPPRQPDGRNPAHGPSAAAASRSKERRSKSREENGVATVTALDILSQRARHGERVPGARPAARIGGGQRPAAARRRRLQRACLAAELREVSHLRAPRPVGAGGRRMRRDARSTKTIPCACACGLHAFAGHMRNSRSKALRARLHTRSRMMWRHFWHASITTPPQPLSNAVHMLQCTTMPARAAAAHAGGGW